MSDPIGPLATAYSETVKAIDAHVARIHDGRLPQREDRLAAIDEVLESSGAVLARLEDFIDTFEKAELVEKDVDRLAAAVLAARRWVSGETRDLIIEIGQRGEEIKRLALFGWREDWYQSRATWAWQQRQMREVSRLGSAYEAPPDVDRLLAAAQSNRPSLMKWDKAVFVLDGLTMKLLDKYQSESV